MITPAFGLTATERVLPRLALDFTTATLDSRITFTRTTDATHPATYINSSGVLTVATNNQPRFDYDPVTLVCKGLLIEESRANSLLNTDLLSTQIVTVTAAVRTLSFYGTGSVTLSGAHTAVVSGTGAYPTRTTYSFTPTAGALTLTVAGTVQFAQLEAGAFATSYIPTTTTALTRNADVATMTGTNFSDWFNASEGTFQAQVVPSESSTTGRRFLQASDGTSANTIMLLKYASFIFECDASSATQCVISKQTITANTQYKIAGSYKANNFQFAVAGSLGTADTSGSVPTGVNQMGIGCTPAGTGLMNGWMQKITYYPQALLPAETQAISK